MYLLVILALPFVSSLIASLLPARARKLQATLAGTVATICAVMVAWVYPEISAGHIIQSSTPWVPAHGLSFTLRMDGLAWLFSFIITSMGALIALYAHYYLSAQDPVRRFFSFLQAFMGSMLGVVLSGNLIQMVVFWELTSLSSFMLIAYWYHRRDARRGARMSLIITGTGGIFLLAGMLMLGQMAGSYDLGTVLKSGDQIRAHAWYPLMLLLISIGALSKSAQFPFHIWLPQAMAAPTPVSAYLHSATMVKAGVFLLARLWPVLAGTTEWAIIIGGAGLISLTMGAYTAMFQRDMKGVLAYSTISHLGLITLLLGLNSSLALVAALFHIMNHATFKASLFMAAGIVDHETGTRNLNRLSGLRHAMPITATLATVAAAAMAGVPLLNGFISKEMFFSEAITAGNDNTLDYLLPLIAVIAGSFSVAYSLRFIREVFFGPVATDLPRPPHEPPLRMLIPSGILVLTCLLVGIAPALTFGPFLASAARSIMGADMPTYNLHIWHGFNLPLLMSLIATVAGIIIVWFLAHYYPNRQGRTPFLYRFDGRHLFEVFMEWIEVKANALLDRLYSPRLQRQILLIFFVTMLVTVLPLTRGTWLRGPIFTPIDPYFLLIWIIGGACAIGAAYQAKFHRPASLLLSGGAGLVTCLTFAWLSAPDLALTQLTVEVVTLVLILLGLRWLPPRVSSIRHPEDDSNRAALRRSRDFLIAITAGLGVALLAYSIMTRPPSSNVASFFVEQSLPLGGGANVVNVILVDFRGFDTFGEITVLGIVALTVFALLRRFRPPVEAIALPLARRQNIRDSREAVFVEPDPDALLPDGIMRIPAVLVRLLLPIATLISLYFLLRGHNLPGGGFVGGLIMATAIILQYIVGGVVWMESRPLIQPQTWIATGMLTAGAAAMMVWWFDKPFLAAQSWDLTLPVIGTIHTSSALFFDIGVYLLVIGSTVLMLIALAHQSLRFYRKLPAAHAALTAKQEQL
ncbi:monovalent cation/H+ antiporter subunit A [Alcaligenes endophyticus]|uniref:Monovalent cation/H+ antiporter subunit A n=1 Tax=Alcaligenes endophyticus TaxID=1929088 RepID=A0ABT8EL39_9BURK|nr:monovalent cation/H+ antiporter subunit A [Alcaligenes endophyticus]MCX5590618.1 monovalent cation/H+ antiporter subunit A [Alcaligenes endophyticus]MDN4122018.1 monovalent cation/H+ antiporter subunit A [Alcaligenes endophyticus]